MTATHADSGVDIAIVGMAGRFPGANSVEALWDLLARGAEAFTPVTPEEARAQGAGRLLDNPDYVPVTATVDQVDAFDAVFFGYNAQQATELDPQQRLFLECAWHALEDACCDPETFDGSVGVFAGSGLNRYALLRERQSQETVGGYNQTLASDKDFLATRASYKLGLTGPSMAVQTACSTSLVAVHVACQNLLLQECDLALAGGVSLQVPQGVGYVAQEGGILSPDGHCRAFDAHARGTVPGSGVAAVALQRLSDAIESGRRIYAVIKSSAVNNDGAEKVGFTAPSVRGQVNLLAQAHAGLDTARITLLEAHGTGTQLGDAIELKALDQIFGPFAADAPFCAVGSIKTNIGHLDTAAGVTGLIKIALCLQKKTLVPSLHFSAPHPELESSRALYVNTRFRPWPDDGQARRAAVSSFGIGGTNAHVVLEEAPVRSVPKTTEDQYVFPLSARTASALSEGRANLADHLRRWPEQPLADIARTLQVGRQAFRFRHVFRAGDRADLLTQLEGDRLDWSALKDRDVGREATLLLSGWDGELVDLASGLHRDGDPDVRRETEALCASLSADAAAAVRAVFAAGGGAHDPRPAALGGFAAQYVLANVVRRWIPGLASVVGEGQGRITALCLGGGPSAQEVIAALDGGLGAASEVRGSNPPALRLLSPETGEPLAGDPLPSLTSLLEATGADSARAKLHKAGEAVLELGAGGLGVVAALSLRADDGSTPRVRLLAAAGGLWLRGVSVDWPQMCRNADRQLIDLPGYAFQRRRYWATDAAKPAAAAAKAASDRLPPEQWFSAPTWRTTQPLALGPAGTAPTLVIADAESFSGTLAQRLEATGAPVIVAVPGRAFQPLPDGRYAADLASPEQLTRLLRSLGPGPLRIVHCGALEAADGASNDFNQAQEHGYLPLLALAQALQKVEPAAGASCLVLTRGAAAVPGDRSPDPRHATLHALATVIAQEIPALAMQVIDLPAGAVDGETEPYLEWILAELERPSPEPLLAYRNGRRLVRGFQALTLTDRPSAGRLKKHGAYLVSGGLGAIGLSLAEELGRSYGARLILLGRSALPERSKWSALAGADTDPRSGVVRRLLAIESAGGAVMTACTDVADEAAVRRVVEAAERRFGRIDGVFHLAAELGDASVRSPLAKLDRSTLHTQCAPKVDGFRVLDRVFKRKGLDVAVAFSSNSATLGGRGFGAYAAANAYLDVAVAGARSLEDVPWTAVSWDGWVADRNAVPEPSMIDHGEGMAALRRILDAAVEPHVLVSATPLLPRLPRPAAPAAGVQAEGVTKVQRQERPALENAYVAPRTSLERKIVDIWEETLGVSGVGVEDDLFALGADSLSAMSILGVVREQFGVEVPLRAFVEKSTTPYQLSVELVSSMAARQGAARGSASGQGAVHSSLNR